MIKNNQGEKISPRIKAQDLIMDALAMVRGYWDNEGMTETETQKVNEQLKKECDRIAKKFKFEKSWIG